MKKTAVLFLVLCMLLCLVPFAGMAVRPTTESTENRKLSAFPSLLKEDGGLNTAFFQDFDQYFNEHFAFRNELVCADARIQSEVFGVSASERVIVGSDGWLYYASTLDDYLGASRLSGRELCNLAHNLALIDGCVRARGGRFVFAVAPNKNTLYGEAMPYYDSLIADPAHNVDLLAPLLSARGVGYADLPALFRAEDEILYLRRDSHWNRKGALLAYRALMDALALPYDDYADVPVSRAVDDEGDLNRMLYTYYGKPGANYRYELPQRWRFVSGDDASDDWIETRGGEGNPSLLMYRDSFGDTLFPFLAGQFELACFGRETPFRLEERMEEYAPEAVIFEKVERNLPELLTYPPILSAPETALEHEPQARISESAASLAVCAFDADYYWISGTADPAFVGETTELLLRVNGVCHAAFHTGEYGFGAYLRRESVGALPARVELIARSGEELLRLGAWTLAPEEASP